MTTTTPTTTETTARPPKNPNPIAARLARAEIKYQRLVHVLDDLRQAIDTAKGLLSHEEPSTALKAANCIGQLAVSYVRVYETGELETRLIALEESANQGRQSA